MNKSESKYYHTALRMDQALIELMEKKDFAYITVKEICEKAGVNRTTFYLHYTNAAELLEETRKMISQRFRDSVTFSFGFLRENIETASLSELVIANEVYLRPFLRFMKENRSLFRAAYRNPESLQVRQYFEMIMERFLKPVMDRFTIPEPDQIYWISFFVQGCLGILREWLMRDCVDPMEDVLRILIACVGRRRAITAFNKGADHELSDD